MEQFISFGIVGLSTAAIYAIIGSGLVVTYTTTGVFNFAHGATGMMAAFSYWQLSVGWGWPVWLSVATVLLVLAPAFGLLVELLVRPVQALGEAEKLVMTIALLSGLIALARWIWSPNKARTLPKFFAEQDSFQIGAATVSWHQAITMLVAVVVAAGLRILMLRTRTGTEMRATVDDRALVGLTGADPVRANRVAWILGTVLAAIGGILIAPMVALDATQLSLVIVSAYAAAIFGRLKSLPMTFVGAIVVGCMESYLTGYLPQSPYLPGLRLAAPAILLLLALLLFPHGRLRRRDRHLSQVPLPTVRGTIAFAGVIVAFGLILATVLGEGDLITYGQIFAFGVIALSFVPLVGYAGQISLAQLTMAGVGAIVCARLGGNGQWWALLAVMVIAGIVGAVIAVPALRLSGVYLALGTAAIAAIFDRWIFTLPSFEVFGTEITLFDQGSVELVGPRLFGFAIDTPAELTVFSAVCLALVTLGVAMLRRGRLARRLIALRDSEAAFATLGGSLLLTKMLVFALSAGIAGLGGALYGMQLMSISAEQFSFVAGLGIFLIAVVGGLGVVGNGLFTGTMIAGPLNAIVALWPAAANLVQTLPAAAGLAYSSGAVDDGLVPSLRRRWEPALRDPVVMAALLGWIGALWILRLVDVVNGYVLIIGAVAGILAARSWGVSRQREAPAQREIPVEWWGLERPWTTEDEEVLDRAIAARS
ncbi:ABC transporter permease [Rhodococcus sp. AD45-ID]|uniref:branched-chain amino acid ABC transporter permease n=1 Tax=unclassified Rhodococcus (in: high G+C Gram-positive bacteria) TaxID=192944 RepID=UPI0005D3419F|nr:MULTISPECIES: ABC transporter permease [unclassified Rhodococcus (in: high G+C Gram-positive bacteria)]KJF23587.1 LIV-I protein H [Rhodococcus sp. AD45]PSR42007.1 ABC transporter permease [Rhodococcus sp. AD45-ID]